MLLYQTALYLAVEKGNLEMVKLLLTNEKIDANLVCTLNKKKESKKKIIEMTPIQLALYNNNEKIVHLFLSNNYTSFSHKIDVNLMATEVIINDDIDAFKKTLLYMSIERRNIGVIQALLLRNDLDINEKSIHCINTKLFEDKTALHLAVEIEDVEIIKLLLEKKEIDINIKDLCGKKPIDYTKNETIKQLLSH